MGERPKKSGWMPAEEWIRRQEAIEDEDPFIIPESTAKLLRRIKADPSLVRPRRGRPPWS